MFIQYQKPSLNFKLSLLLIICIVCINSSSLEHSSSSEDSSIRNHFDGLKYSCGSEVDSNARSNLYDGRLWPHKTLVFWLHESLSTQHRANFFTALRDIVQHTCIQFSEWNRRDPAYILIWQNNSNNSHCGSATACYTGGKQDVQMRWDCSRSYLFTHELLHSLCLIHEQERLDRNEYLSFDKCTEPSRIPKIVPNQRSMGTMYDYMSQMHYYCDDCFGRPKLQGVQYCGSEQNFDGLSVLDADKINSYYNCQGCHRHRWLNVKTLTSAQMGQLVDFAAHPGDREPIYVCRAYGKEGEIAPGRFIPKEGICQMASQHRTWNITGKMEVFALPNGYNKITATTYGYRLTKELSDKPKFVGVGRTNRNYKLYLAVTEDDSEGELKTYVGHLQNKHLMLDATFSHPIKGEFLSRNYSVVMCSL